MTQCRAHPERPAQSFCRNCGQPVCEECRTDLEGVTHCPECLEKLTAAKAAGERARAAREPEPPAMASTPPPRPGGRRSSGELPAVAAPDAPHPVIAAVLGFVPGLGAVYNGQYVKGVLHVMIFGLLMAIATSSKGPGVALAVPMIVLLVLYMPIDAVRTAQSLRRGEEVDEMSGLVGTLFRGGGSAVPGIALIAIGVLLLLFTLGTVRLENLLPYWPVLLILLGAYRLWSSVNESRAAEPVPPPQDDPAAAADLELRRD